MNLYEDLGVNKNATKEELKQGYRTKAKKNHPDKGGSAEEMAKSNFAYKILSDEKKRIIYDQTGFVDDKNPDNNESVAINKITHIFFSILQQWGDRCNEDIIEVIKININQNKNQLNENIKNQNKEIKRLTKVLNKLKFKNKLENKNNFLKYALEAAIKQNEQGVYFCGEEIKSWELAFSLVNDYEFDFDRNVRPQPQQTQGYTISFGTGSTTGGW